MQLLRQLRQLSSKSCISSILSAFPRIELIHMLYQAHCAEYQVAQDCLAHQYIQAQQPDCISSMAVGVCFMLSETERWTKVTPTTLHCCGTTDRCDSLMLLACILCGEGLHLYGIKRWLVHSPIALHHHVHTSIRIHWSLLTHLPSQQV